MINKAVYICEYCRKQYFSRDECQKCEESHAKIEQMEIVGMKYLKDYTTVHNCPNDIMIKVSRPGQEDMFIIYSYCNVSNDPRVRDVTNRKADGF